WTISEDEMIKPSTFLKNKGYKGTQLTVLRPGKYPLHPVLWNIKYGNATVVQTGEVAVVRSNVRVRPELKCEPIDFNSAAGGNVSSSLVPKGCKGVWAEALGAGSYFLNEMAFTPTIQS